MTALLLLALGVVLAGCSTAPKQPAQPTQTPILLPTLAVPGVKTDHPLQRQEVAALAAEYFKSFVCGCGMPDKPVDRGGVWRVQLWGGYLATDYGRFLISRDGQQVILVPPRSGLRSSTRSMLSRNGVRQE